MKRIIIIGLAIMAFNVLAFDLQNSLAGEKSNLPESKEATLIEVVSPTEWGLEASGIGRGKKKMWQENAMLDAKRSAIWFILYGQDGLLQTDEEREKIRQCRELLFVEKTIEGFITWINLTPKKQKEIEGGKALKVVVELKVNRKMVGDWLVDHCGFAPLPTYPPSIMVLPEVPKGTNPIEVLYNDPLKKKGAEVVESYLTTLKYEVLVPKQETNVNEIYEQLKIVKDIQDDYTYMLSLAFGSDVYINYNIQIEKKIIESTQTKKAIVGVRAYETTTARLLGTETGYSEFRPSPEAVVLEEAMNDAVGKVLTRINAYWKEDWRKGTQYRMIFNAVCEDFDEDQKEDCSDIVADCLGEHAAHVKENIITDDTYDFRVWAREADFKNIRALYRTIKKCFTDEFTDGKLKRDLINRKLLVAKVKCAE